MSRYLCETLTVGSDAVSFLHIPQNVKRQAPFDDLEHVCMLVGGTGITPFIQALHAILGNSNNNNHNYPIVTMLYGSRVAQDIVAYELLHQWAAAYPEQFRLIDILSQEPADSDWSGQRGFINQAVIAEHFPKPSDSKFQIWVCGPPPLYNVLCGPREEPAVVTGILGDMGYSPEQVYKF
jgi:cytochrome-b5 reductase